MHHQGWDRHFRQKTGYIDIANRRDEARGILGRRGYALHLVGGFDLLFGASGHELRHEDHPERWVLLAPAKSRTKVNTAASCSRSAALRARIAAPWANPP